MTETLTLQVQQVQKGDVLWGWVVESVLDDGINTAILFDNGETLTFYTGEIVTVER